MGFFEAVGQLCYLLSKDTKHEYVVFDQQDREYRVKAKNADRAVSEVIKNHPFSVHANRCWAQQVLGKEG